jgi:hypothetical protein
MPRQMWKHECCGGWTSAPDCSCGVAGTYEGWQYCMYELMARFQYITGMKPIGPHHMHTVRVLLKHRVECSNCHGNGLVDGDGNTYAICAPCEALGSFWTIPLDEVEAIRRQILAEFPNAGAPRATGRFFNGPAVLDLAAGEMLTDE